MLIKICAFLLLVTMPALARVRVFKQIDDPLLGQMNVTYAFQLTEGLTDADKQHILDMHNILRKGLAEGEETESWDGKKGRAPMPKASNMQAVDWDDDLARYAQKYASTCKKGHSDLKQLLKMKRFSKSSLSENLSGDITYLEKDMYGEVHDWDYNSFSCRPFAQCGHYKPFAGWAYNRVGCGWKVCKNPVPGFQARLSLVCVYAGYDSTPKEADKPRLYYQHEYFKGKPCSRCMQGWDYCMEDALCATKTQCLSSKLNNCRCLNNKEKCEANGGKFDKSKCACKCPPLKMGINCAQKCADEVRELCGMGCPQDAASSYFCQKSCGGCGSDMSAAYKFNYITNKATNAKNFEVRAKFIVPDTLAVKVDLSKNPLSKKCPNAAANNVCQILAARGYCKDAMFGPSIREYCGVSCGKCPKQADISGGDYGSLATDSSYDKVNLKSAKSVGDTMSSSELGDLGSSLGIDLSEFKVVGKRRRRR